MNGENLVSKVLILNILLSSFIFSIEHEIVILDDDICVGEKNCIEIDIRYPKFDEPEQESLKVINSFIQNWVSQKPTYWEWEENRVPEDLFKELRTGFKKYIGDWEGLVLGWQIFRNVKITYLNDVLISLSLENNIYTGGAHGLWSWHFVILSLETGLPLSTKDLLKENAMEKFTEFGEAVFRRVKDIDQKQSLRELGINFKNDQFQLNKNLLIKEGGILFYYNPYEIAGYLAGGTEVFLSKSEIEHLFHPKWKLWLEK